MYNNYTGFNNGITLTVFDSNAQINIMFDSFPRIVSLYTYD